MHTLFQLPEPIHKSQLNPMLVFGIGEPGTRCKDCRFLKKYQQAGTWFKCQLRPSGGKATDHRANWQACAKFQSLDPSCTGCQSKRLDDCIC